MAHIGAFIRTADGYSGRLRTLTLDIELTLVPADSGDGENAPDFRIHRGESADGPEVGAGWRRIGEKAGEYVSLLIDDPVFAQPILANLFQDEAAESGFHLVWNRTAKRKERAQHMRARSPLTSRSCHPGPIALFDRDAGNSFVLIGAVVALAHGLDQVRPQSRAHTSPFADARTRGCSRQIESKVRLAGTAAAAIAIVMIGAPIAMPFASPACAESDQAVVGRLADPFGAFVAEASLRFGVPARWIRAVMRAESQNDLHAISPKGAIGLMQIMPSTWTLLRARLRLGADPYDPRDNILAGAAFLRELHDRYGSPGFLAAYNAGPGRYENHLATGQPLPAETRAYVAALAPLIDDGRVDDSVPVVSAARSWARAPLFISQDHGVPAVDQALLPSRPNHLSNGRRVVDVSALAPRSDSLFVQVSAREPVR